VVTKQKKMKKDQKKWKKKIRKKKKRRKTPEKRTDTQLPVAHARTRGNPFGVTQWWSAVV
jgi:hypothetical protein